MPKKIYLFICIFCTSLIVFALCLQHMGWLGVHYPPCPLCIFQRIGFIGIGLSCLLAFFIRPLQKFWHFLAILFGLFGLIVALRHAWVIAHPETSCGIDPLEVFINQFPIVQAMPFLFKADGFCSIPLPPVVFLTVPQWSLIFFSVFVIVLLITFFKKSNGKL
jgi:protein dithiol:quinone oxidoreductase